MSKKWIVLITLGIIMFYFYPSDAYSVLKQQVKLEARMQDKDEIADLLLSIQEGQLYIAYKDLLLKIDKIQGMAKEDIEEAFNGYLKQPQCTILYSDARYEYIVVYYNIPSCGVYGSNIYTYVIQYDKEANRLEKVLDYKDIKVSTNLNFQTKTLDLSVDNADSITADVSEELNKYDYRLETLKNDTIIVTRPYNIEISDYDDDGYDELELNYPLLAPNTKIYFRAVKIIFKVEDENFKVLTSSFVDA